jgi:YopX protein
MREFKFRVWDSVYLNWKDPEDYTYTELFLDDKYIVQQFTGMVDKNGKEIYEGDIVDGSIDIDPSGTYQQRMLVSWSHPNGYNWTYYKLDTLKVVGNFYENPELLEYNDN